MKNKNVLLLTILTIITLLTSVIGATYAYFTAVKYSESKTSLEVYTSSHDQIIYTGVNVYLNVPYHLMNKNTASNEYLDPIIPNDPGELRLETTVGSLGGTNECVYDVVYTPLNEGAVKPFEKSLENKEGYKEYAVRVKVTADGPTSLVSGPISSEVDLTGVKEKITLISGAVLSVYGEKVKGAASWEVIPVFYNLEFSQQDNSEKTFGGTVSIENLTCYNDMDN